MKRVILTSFISLAAFTSVISADVKPAQAHGAALYKAGKGAYNSAQEGDYGTFIFCAFLVVASVVAAVSNSK